MVPAEDFGAQLPRFKYLVNPAVNTMCHLSTCATQVNVDGVVASFRMAMLLGAGSVVLMQAAHMARARAISHS